MLVLLEDLRIVDERLTIDAMLGSPVTVHAHFSLYVKSTKNFALNRLRDH